MAESPIERLKRLAKEKKEAAAKLVAAPEVPEVLVTQPVVEETSQLSAEKLSHENNTTDAGISGSQGSNAVEGHGSTEESVGRDSNDLQVSVTDVQVASVDTDSAESGTDVKPSSSNHPLAMEFAEMEQALLTKDPGFKMILRNIHRQLALDPDLVTQMTEAEIQSVVSGLVVMANAEVVEPAKAKTLKAKVAAAKKAVISVDDL